MKQVQDALSTLGIPVMAGIWRATSPAQNPPAQYVVYSTTTTEGSHHDDQVTSFRTYVYLNLWSDIDPTETANRIRSMMYAAGFSMIEAMDVMIKWFCILFQNQFTPDDVLDGYPVDRLMHDIALALMAVQTQTTSILDEFPTKAAQTETATTQTEAVSEEIPLF